MLFDFKVYTKVLIIRFLCKSNVETRFIASHTHQLKETRYSKTNKKLCSTEFLTANERQLTRIRESSYKKRKKAIADSVNGVTISKKYREYLKEEMGS